MWVGRHLSAQFPKLLKPENYKNKRTLITWEIIHTIILSNNTGLIQELVRSTMSTLLNGRQIELYPINTLSRILFAQWFPARMGGLRLIRWSWSNRRRVKLICIMFLLQQLTGNCLKMEHFVMLQRNQLAIKELAPFLLETN